jgi:hypothetical protein
MPCQPGNYSGEPGRVAFRTGFEGVFELTPVQPPELGNLVRIGGQRYLEGHSSNQHVVVFELHPASDWILGIVKIDTSVGKRDWSEPELFVDSLVSRIGNGLFR